MTERVFPEEKGLEIKDELLSIHALVPFARECSSSRCHMASNHLSQSLVILHGDEKIIQSGLETQFGKNTFSVKADEDVRILKIIPRYQGIDANSVNKVVETLIIIESLETGEIDYISIPYFHKLDKNFGFKYVKNEEVTSNLRTNDIIRKDTILADSPTVTKNSGYRYGVNANVCLANLPETTEDGVVISERLSQKMCYEVFEERHIEFGTEDYPLNLYGDDKNYKPFPEIGEFVNQYGALMALRKTDTQLSPALTSINDVREFNPIFDKVIYVKEPGREYEGRYGTIRTGEVVDIKVYANPKFKKELYTGVTDGIEKYATALKRYYESVYNAYEELKKEHYAKFKDNNLPMSRKFHRLVIEAMAMANPKKKKIGYTYKNEQLDLVRISFVVRYTILPNVGHKISDSHGCVSKYRLFYSLSTKQHVE